MLIGRPMPIFEQGDNVEPIGKLPDEIRQLVIRRIAEILS